MKKVLLVKFLAILLLQFSFNAISQVALAFNGVNNYVSTNGSPVLNNLPRTVDAWIKTTSSITTQMVICDWGALSPNSQRFTLNLINSKLRIEVGGVGFAGTTNLNTGQWFHVTAVYSPTISSGPNAFLYVNGIPEASGTFTGYPVLSTTTTVGFRIGVRVDGINFFSGAVDEVKVYNYARTQAQVLADTLELCGPQPGLVAYYKLNEGIANAINTGSTNAIDYSGFNNNGTLNSFTLSGTTSNWVPGRITTGAPTIFTSPGQNICSGSSVSLSANAAPNYTWSTGNSSSTLIVVSPTVTTIYSLSAVNSVSCLTTSFVTITVNNSLPSVTVSASQNPICLGASTSFSASGAATYTWSGGIVNAQTFTPSATSSYSLSAGNGCGVVNSVHSITVIPLPVTIVASPTLVCEGYTCNLTASASASGFTWTPGGQTGSNVIVTPLLNTIYTVSASNGTCVGTQTLLVSTKTTPSISTSSTLVTICEGQSASLVANGAGNSGTYTWSPGSGTGANITINPTVSIIFSVNGTNSVGCSSSAQVPVVVIAKPAITAGASKTLICTGESVTLTASGATSYSWSSGVTTASTQVTPLSALNVFTISATASGNSCTATQTIAIAVITPSVSYSSSLTICAGASSTLSASGASTYSWNNIPAGTSGQQVISPSSSSTYTLVANTQSLSTNCLSTYVATVTVYPNPTVSAIASITTTICKGITNTLTALGANSYTWTGISSNSPQMIVSPGITTNYTVVGRSINGCENTALVQVKISSCSALLEFKENPEFIVYPNPARDELHITTYEEMTLWLYSVTGQVVKTVEISNGRNIIDVRTLPEGIYSLKVKSSTMSISKKIIIQ